MANYTYMIIAARTQDGTLIRVGHEATTMFDETKMVHSLSCDCNELYVTYDDGTSEVLLLKARYRVRVPRLQE